MKVTRVFTLALATTLTGCAAEAVAPQEEDVKATVAEDADDVWASSLNTYISKVSGEKQGAFKGGVIQSTTTTTTTTP